jgi:hypothetical protein
MEIVIEYAIRLLRRGDSATTNAFDCGGAEN